MVEPEESASQFSPWGLPKTIRGLIPSADTSNTTLTVLVQALPLLYQTGRFREIQEVI